MLERREISRGIIRAFPCPAPPILAAAASTKGVPTEQVEGTVAVVMHSKSRNIYHYNITDIPQPSVVGRKGERDSGGRGGTWQLGGGGATAGGRRAGTPPDPHCYRPFFVMKLIFVSPVTFFAVTQTGVSQGGAVQREGEDAEMIL